MYHYKNKKTGAVIKSACKVTGKNWELLKDEKQPPVKSSAEDDVGKNLVEQVTKTVEETAEESAEGPSEAAASGEKKTTRKGKK